MENLQLTGPEFPACANPGRRRTGTPRAANDNGHGAPSPRLMAVAAAGVAAPPLTVAETPSRWRRFASGFVGWLNAWNARRLRLEIERWPDHRLERMGITRREIAARVREIYGMPPPGGTRSG